MQRRRHKEEGMRSHLSAGCLEGKASVDLTRTSRWEGGGLQQAGPAGSRHAQRHPAAACRALLACKTNPMKTNTFHTRQALVGKVQQLKHPAGQGNKV